MTSMHLRALVIEDSTNDALLVERELRRGGYEPVLERVDTRAGLAEALEHGTWDVVISDYGLPGWSGTDALATLLASGKDLPFILISGAIGEEIAVQAIKAGANDYLLKDRLARLPAAVARALEEAELRRERRRSEAALAFLEQASIRLSQSLDQRAIGDILVELAVPLLGEAALVDMVAEPTGLRRLATHSSIADVLFAGAAGSRDGGADPVVALAADVVHSGVRIMRELASAGDTPALSLLGVPLTLRDGVLGALTFAVRPPARVFAPSDIWLAEELARRASLALENARLYERARAAIAARDEFLLIASHELKTPLTPLVLHVRELVRMATADARLRDFGDNLGNALGQVQRLTSLVDQLLDVSRLAVDRMQLAREHLDLAAMVRDLADAFRAQAAEAGSSLEVRSAAAVWGSWDGARLRQAVANLLSNALKFGAGKPVELTVERCGASARVVVCDCGPGIAAIDQARIFERFERAVSLRRYGGFGIGLWVAREVVEAHGGSIVAASAPGAGATFTIELPMEAGAPAP